MQVYIGMVEEDWGVQSSRQSVWTVVKLALKVFPDVSKVWQLLPTPKWYHGLNSPSLCFTSIHLPLWPCFHLHCLALCPHFLSLTRCWLQPAAPSSTALVWNNETANNAGDASSSSILTSSTMRPLVALQHMDYLRVHNSDFWIAFLSRMDVSTQTTLCQPRAA